MMHASDMHDCHMMQQRHDSHSASLGVNQRVSTEPENHTTDQAWELTRVSTEPGSHTTDQASAKPKS